MLKENHTHINKQSQDMKHCDCFNFKGNNSFLKEI